MGQGPFAFMRQCGDSGHSLVGQGWLKRDGPLWTFDMAEQTFKRVALWPLETRRGVLVMLPCVVEIERRLGLSAGLREHRQSPGGAAASGARQVAAAAPNSQANHQRDWSPT